MALTSEQNIPSKPEVHEPWTFRRLFTFAGAVTALTKSFVNPLDVLLGYLVFILGISELIGNRVSWFFWVLTLLILLCCVLERHTGLLSDAKKEEKK